MKTDIQRIISLKNYFRIAKISNENVTYSLEHPSRMLIQNIRGSWLRFLLNKTYKNFPVYINKNIDDLKEKNLPFGLVKLNVNNSYEHQISQNLDRYSPELKTELKFSIVLNQRDLMPYFIQWQRYRKYWWSSITTTPSLFSINDIRNGDSCADVDIIANFGFGPQPVETISYTLDKCSKDEAEISCSISLEKALITLLLESCNTEEHYLRLHRKMAPYKISIAVNSSDPEQNESLKEVALVLNHKLQMKQIPVWYPDHNQPLKSQLQDALKIGVPYTAILSENVLSNGIFHLMNSSTLLREQVHTADFESYATLLFKN